jgi:hypothetical protein
LLQAIEDGPARSQYRSPGSRAAELQKKIDAEPDRRRRTGHLKTLLRDGINGQTFGAQQQEDTS